ncbi:hypothetical protein I2494_08395 [Budviciaceae bacterium BWR-B9]|uniref:Uncharacterized protein n=1 Tax=Limnobaculum allomyrinae TaxID=2791986 RepID=A0ABS1IQ12_9GAMM|nr:MULTISPECIES: hypothetical protein [Limnobaculum]MBK5143734.1 hypothetical protein [Limnobaculum allomyrinae]MBV7693473.1 hypothetical protein [Limnobaculum sp. M2-1]
MKNNCNEKNLDISIQEPEITKDSINKHRKWLEESVIKSIEDSRPSVSHEAAQKIFTEMKRKSPLNLKPKK